MNRIARPLDTIKPHYDVVVIGSGYGGSISASRMARAGRRVCLLERGREILPGEYPDSPSEAVAEMQAIIPDGNEGTLHIGSKTALFDMHVDEDINVLVGCGLGGTSLINANVSIRPEPRVFQQVEWPAEVRNDSETLDRCYALAEGMLKPTPYPEHLPLPRKTVAHLSCAEAVGAPAYRASINVTFEAGENQVGVHQEACTLCGNCVTGCNYSAKNTVLMNYLPDAVNHGAEIFCEASVRHLERRDGRWVVHFEYVGVGREKFQGAELFVTADVVVVSAGTLGSNGILMRSRERGLSTSDQLGKKYSGNGDLLGFAYNTADEIRGVGWFKHPEDDPVGPCITSIIDARNQPEMHDGFIVEEGAIPGALSMWLSSAFEAAASIASKETTNTGLKATLEGWRREAVSLFTLGREGAVNNTQTYLVMAHDDGRGELFLAGDQVRLSWPGVGTQPIFETAANALTAAAGALKGTFVPNPTWTTLLRKSLVTVHPLGGCAMGDDASSGVVNHKGQVFTGNGTDVHPGLYVSDGSIVPRPLGVNPLLTISALTERNCMHIARDHGWTIDYALPSRPKETRPAPRVGVRFTETMKGWLSLEQLEDYQAAAKHGEEAGSSFAFTLTIGSEDLDDLVNNPQHPARMAGTVTAPALSSQPLMVTEGHFNLFVQDPEDPLTKRMKYRMLLHSVEGKQYWFDGFKVIRDDAGFDLWSDTTTLYITVREGTDHTGKVVGKGMLWIQATDFAKQLTTLKVLNADGRLEELAGAARFGKAFAGALWDTYGPG